MFTLWILCFSLHLIPAVLGGQPGLQKPVEGRPFILHCTYKPGYEANTKYVSKISNSTSWEVFRTSEHNTLIKNGKFSFYDDTSKKEVRMTFSNVTVEDSGKYEFGIDVLLLPDPSCKVQLYVQRDLSGQTQVNFTTQANHHSVEGDEGHNQFETWFSLPILVCVCALLIVCVFSLLLLFKMHCNTEHNDRNTTPITLSYRPEGSQLSDYETESSVAVNQTQSSAAAESETLSDTEASIPVYAEVQRQSQVYQNLRAETFQEAIYQSLDDANEHESNIYRQTFKI